MMWIVSLVIAYGHFNLPRGFVWVYMSKHTHFIERTPANVSNASLYNMLTCETIFFTIPRSIYPKTTRGVKQLLQIRVCSFCA